MDIINKTTEGGVGILTIGFFNIFDSMDDRIILKNAFENLFAVGDNVFFFFHREENLIASDELAILRKNILEKIEETGGFKYLNRIDDQRFEAIAYAKLDYNFPNLFIDLFKYYYSCDFFKPINDLTFDEYEDYIDVNGTEDIDGVKMIQNKLTDMICIKGLGADHMVVSYNLDLHMPEIL
ncbi:hypothetical protein ACTJKN_02560 [Pedobacter sp. 22163]|uniref:hypothetical protein n=1 Tax=Pedobacter sp. 22163 TaxID=3453883 RepID=UPI003F854A3E